MAKYVDLGDEAEDERIRQIGNAAMQGKKTAFITDADPGKADRYIAKLLRKFPAIEVTGRYPGPVKNTVSVIVERKQQKHEAN